MPNTETVQSGAEAEGARLQQENRALKERLQVIERERIEYLQNISHQLVAPLNAIKWHIENLTEARVGIERAKKVLRSIYSQSTLAVHLAKNFNLMSNLEADHALSQMREPLLRVNLRRLLVNLADDFQPLAWDQQITIIVEDSRFDNSPEVLVIKSLISQTFSNIIENAVKYSSRDTTIEILGKHVPKEGYFVVSIRNQGIPLSSEEIARVFERGFRSHQAKQRYPAGTGFGLYIAKRIVDIHEGKIMVSTQGKWTIFEVALPVDGLKGKASIRE